MEWDAHKVTPRGHCIQTSWGARITLQKELGHKERELRNLELSVLACPDNYTCLQEVREQCRDKEVSLAKFNFEHYTARLQREGDCSRRLLAWLVRDEQVRTPISAIRDPKGHILNSQTDINSIFAIIIKRYTWTRPPGSGTHRAIYAQHMFTLLRTIGGHGRATPK